MKIFRGVVSMLLVIVGSAALACGSVLWWIDGNVFDTNAFSTRTSEVLSDPPVQGLLSREISEKVMVFVTDEALRPQVTALVAQIVSDERALTLMDEGVREGHAMLVDGTSPTIRLNLRALATEVRQQIVTGAPTLDATLPPADTWFDFELAQRDELPSIYQAVDRFHTSAVALLILGACLIGLALVLGPARWALLMVAGLGLAGFGTALWIGLRAALGEAENRVTDPVAQAASKNVFGIFFNELNRQSITLMVVGGVVGLLGISIGLIRPEYMRERDQWDNPKRNRNRR